MWAPLSHRRGRDGVISWIPILIGSFRFPEYILCENFLPNLKNSQFKLYIIIGGVFTPQLRWGWDDRLRLDLKWFIRVLRTFFNSKFFLYPKDSESTRKPIRWLLPPQKEWRWGDRLDLDLKLFSGVSGTSVQNFRSPAQSARLWPLLVVIRHTITLCYLVFVPSTIALVIIEHSKRDVTKLIGRLRIAFPS